MVMFGRGVIEQLGAPARGRGHRALVITDRGIAATGLVERVSEILRASGIELTVFAGVEPNPTVAQIEAGLSAGAGHNIDLVVSVGGGSAHDCAKMVALVAANGGRVHDY